VVVSLGCMLLKLKHLLSETILDMHERLNMRL
jgi:hypothetical protein